jgi:hypothetical protein
MADRPAWRQVFDRLERRVGGPLESLVAASGFMSALATAAQVQRHAQQRVERATERALRLVNLPAASDLDRLARQVGVVERQLRELSDEVQAVGREADARG